MAHSQLPPSSAELWMRCFGWYEATKDIPEPPTSPYAAEGTDAHEVLYLSLGTSLPPSAFTDDTEMQDHVSGVVDWVDNYVEDHPGTEVFLEQFMQWYDLGDGQGGTSDVVFVSDDAIGILDFKYGKGVDVDVRDNPQLLLYLIGAVKKYGKRDRYWIGVAQPRTKREVATQDDIDLNTFYKEARHAAQKNFKGGERTAGDHCRKWCKASGSCGAFAKMAIGLAQQEFERL